MLEMQQDLGCCFPSFFFFFKVGNQTEEVKSHPSYSRSELGPCHHQGQRGIAFPGQGWSKGGLKGG